MPSYTGPLYPTDPITMLLMQGSQPGADPAQQEAIAHYLALFGSPPGPPPRGPGGFQPVNAPGTYIAPPPGPQSQDGGGRTTGLPTGATDAKPPLTTGITGSDGQSPQDPPISYSGSQPPIPMLRPDTSAGASVKDDSVAHIPGEAAGLSAGGGGAFGAATADPTGTSNTGDLSGMQKGITDMGKALAGLAAPAKQDERQGLAPLPSHESRFTPQDLLSLIQALSQSGSKTAPQSLGALIGR